MVHLGFQSRQPTPRFGRITGSQKLRAKPGLKLGGRFFAERDAGTQLNLNRCDGFGTFVRFHP